MSTERTRLHLHPVPPTAARPPAPERPVFDIEAIEAALAAAEPGSPTPLVVPAFQTERPARDLTTRHELHAAAREEARRRDRAAARLAVGAGALASAAAAVVLLVVTR